MFAIALTCDHATELPIELGETKTFSLNGGQSINSWYRFEAKSEILLIKKENDNSISKSNTDVKLYSGECFNLNLIERFNLDSRDQAPLMIHNIHVGEFYYLNVKCVKEGDEPRISFLFVGSDSKNKVDDIIEEVVAVTDHGIPRYSKFESGIALSKSFSNPYNPEQISIKAYFQSPSNNIYTIDGFYYEEFQNSINPPYWNQTPTSHPWRFRFAPNEIGQWAYFIVVMENNVITSFSSIHNLNCISSNNPGYLGISSNKRYLQFSNQSSFFGIAQDLRAFYNNSPAFPTDCPSDIVCQNWCYHPNTLIKHKEWISDFAINGGNLVRIWMEPYGYEIEWENLNHYGSRQNRAHDFDELIEFSASQGVYIHLVLYNEQHLRVQDPTHEGAAWITNPYHQELGLITPIDFFENSFATKHFKNRLRYIIARWGYSTSIGSYGLVNEVEFTGSDSEGNTLQKNYWNSTSAVNKWIMLMADFIKKVSPTDPLISVDYAFGFSNKDVNNYENIDFTNSHYYTWDKNANYQWSNHANHHIGEYSKPSVVTEYGHHPVGCWVAESKETFVHNGIWSSGMSGQFSTNFYYGADSKYNHPCWGQGPCHYLPFSKFVENEDFNSNDMFAPISNAKSLFLASSAFHSPTIDAPCFDHSGLATNSDYLGGTNGPHYLSDGVSTNNDSEVQVFGLKKASKIIGWVHNKNYYWYNIHQYGADPGCDHPLTQCSPTGLLNPNVSSTYPLDNVNSIDDAVLLISGLQCDGIYKVEWWSTQCNYDINGDNIPDDGGVIHDFTAFYYSVNGNLEIEIPSLMPIEFNQEPFAPDYGFKISLYENISSGAGAWSHQYTGGQGLDGWQKVAPDGDIAITSDHKIFYKGNNGQMQHFYWNGSQWLHEATGNYGFNASHLVDGDIEISSNNQIFYRGADGRMQHFYWNNPCSVSKHSASTSDNFDAQENFAIEISDMKVYPNPAESKLSIEFVVPYTGTISLMISDINGITHEIIPPTLMYENQQEIISHDLSHLTKGLYIVRLSLNDKLIDSRRIVLQ